MSLITESQDYAKGGTQKEVYLPEDVVEVACPLCGGDDKIKLYTEYTSIVISKCRSCSLIYTSTRFKTPELIYWGSMDTYYAEARLVFEKNAPTHRDPNYREEIRLIERYKPNRGRFLEVGCNAGMLLRLVKARGWDVTGVEPSPSAAPLARKHGVFVHNCFIHEVPASENGSFDVVALSDVFEHITEPLIMLEHARRLLKDDGVLYIKVPNARWSLFKQHMLSLLLRRSPDQGVWDSYEHVIHYTSETLRAMLNRGSFRPVCVTSAKPVQLPIWQNYVGQWYTYPTPWYLDWKRHIGREFFYQLGKVENILRLGSIGALSPSVVAIAKKG
jgi:SAM-dependent methyltransferase